MMTKTEMMKTETTKTETMKTDDDEDDANEEVCLVEIDGAGTFYTSDEMSGVIYSVEDDEEVGDRVGVFRNGEAVFDS